MPLRCVDACCSTAPPAAAAAAAEAGGSLLSAITRAAPFCTAFEPLPPMLDSAGGSFDGANRNLLVTNEPCMQLVNKSID
jgi:hypothetical protein